MMNGTTAIPAYDAIIESTENTIVPMSSSIAVTASAAGTQDMEPSSAGSVSKTICIFIYYLHSYFKWMKLV